MAFLLSRRLLAVTSKLPFILVASAPLRETSSLFSSEANAPLSAAHIAAPLRRAVSFDDTSNKSSHGHSRAAQANQKELKKQGFNAIIRWCAYHQERAKPARTDSLRGVTVSRTPEEDTQTMDTAVVRWVEESADTFSCGQNLVVLSFLCDVLRLQTPTMKNESRKTDNEDAAEVSSSFSTSTLVDKLTHIIAALLTRAIDSANLSLQPFFILLAATYALDRVTHGNPLGLSADILEALTPPPALWFALVPQLRAYTTQLPDAASMHPAEVNTTIEALLTVLFLFDAEQQKAIFTPGDARMMRSLTERLIGFLQPAVTASRVRRRQLTRLDCTFRMENADDGGNALEVAGSTAIRSAPPHLTDTASPSMADGNHGSKHVDDSAAPTPRETGTYVHGEDDETSLGADDVALLTASLPGQNVSWEDCARMLGNVHRSLYAHAVTLLEYFACVVRDPSAFTRADLEKLLLLFEMVRNVNACKDSGLADDILSMNGVTGGVHTLAPFVTYLQQPLRFLQPVDEELQRYNFIDGPADAPDLRLKLLATDVTAEDAASVLQRFQTKLSWPSAKFLLLRCLADTPELLHAVQRALADTQAGSKHSTIPAREAAVPEPRAKVPLTNVLCGLLRELVLAELPQISAGSANQSAESRRRLMHSNEVFAIARAVSRGIDWHSCTQRTLLGRGDGDDPNVYRLSHSTARVILLAYLDAHYRYHFLTAEDELDDRTLLNALVVALLQRSPSADRRHNTRIIVRLIPRLKSVAYQRQLTERMTRYNAVKAYGDLFAFLRDLAPVATQMQIFSPDVLKLLFNYRSLRPRHLDNDRWPADKVAKTHAVVVARSIRYALAAGMFASGKGAEVPARRERVTGWWSLCLQDILLAQAAHKGSGARASPSSISVAEDAIANAAAAHGSATDKSNDGHEYDQEEETRETKLDRNEKEDTGHHTRDDNDEEGEHDDAAHDDDEAAAGSRNTTVPYAFSSDAVFSSPVTDADVEEILSLLLQVGCKVSSRTTAYVAQRLRDHVFVATVGTVTTPGATAALQTMPEDFEAEDTNRHDGQTPPLPPQQLWSQESHSLCDHQDTTVTANTPPQAPELCPGNFPLPAHFVLAVRADSAVSIPLSPAYLSQLLRACDLRIFHHVVSAFFLASKRRRTLAVLQQDLEVANVAFAVLQARLVACGKDADASGKEGDTVAEGVDAKEQSEVAFKSLVHFLYHLSQLPPRTAHVKALVNALHHPSQTAPSLSQPPTAPATTARAALEARNSMSDAEQHEGEGNGEGDDEAAADREEAPTETGGLDSLLALHALVNANVLQVAAFITANQQKELALAHLYRLAVFFPTAADFAFLQLQPQLSNFTQRELLQVAAQYPPGAPDILAQLRSVDLHVSIDLGEFVPMAKRLPMRICEAIIHAHVPYLTLAWATRILSALASRHEEMPLSLLRTLLERVEAVADTASESDKSLLLLILQGYLLSPSTGSPSALKKQWQRSSDDDQQYVVRTNELAKQRIDVPWIDDYFYASSLAASAPTSSVLRERVELVRHCCDQLLSLEHITTLQELRFFLVSYPPSLHHLREKGVVAKVEQTLLPAMLSASPAKWRDLDGLVTLLFEHHVLLPETVTAITTAFFSRTQLEQLQQSSFLTVESNGASPLDACFRIAVICADALSRATAASEGERTNENNNSSRNSFSLMATADQLLSAFDAPQDWLSALTTLVNVLSKQAGTTATSASHFATGSSFAVARHLAAVLLQETEELNSSEFARLVQNISRLKAWDLTGLEIRNGKPPAQHATADAAVNFAPLFTAMYERADAHSRCVLLKALTTDAAVLRQFEGLVFSRIQGDVALLSAEDLELVLTAALQCSEVMVVEPLLDAVGTRLLPMMDQCRRSTLVRLLQCHVFFGIEDVPLVSSALGALDRQSPLEVKLDAAQVITVLQSIAMLPSANLLPERFLVLAFQRLEKLVQYLTPAQLCQAGQLILDLEMGYIASVHALVTHILESRDGARGTKEFQTMAEELCDVFDVEVPAALRAARLRKRKQRERGREFLAAQRRVAQEARL